MCIQHINIQKKKIKPEMKLLCLFPLIIPCKVDLIGHFDPTTSIKRDQAEEVQGMGTETWSWLRREGLYLNPWNLDNISLPQNYSPPTKIAPKL